MKNTLKILYLLFFTINISCKAQTVPLNTFDYPDGAYLKDLDNVLPFWVGTWKGIVNNKEYTFQFLEFTHHQTTFSDGSFEYEDMLMGKLKVIDLSNNQVLYDDLNDLNNADFENYKIRLVAYRLNEYSFYYLDTEANCSNTVKFTLLKSNTNLNQVEYKNFSYEDFFDFDCPYANQEDIPMFLPKVDLVLTRQ